MQGLSLRVSPQLQTTILVVLLELVSQHLQAPLVEQCTTWPDAKDINKSIYIIDRHCRHTSERFELFQSIKQPFFNIS